MSLFGKTILMGTHVEGISLYGQEEVVQATIEQDNLVFKSVTDKKKTAELNLDKINSARIFTENEIIEKEKSVVGRSIAGTFIAGPIGTIVGGMSGIGNKKENKNYRILQIVYDSDKSIVLLEGKWSANFDKFIKEINKLIKTENKLVL